MRPPLPKLVRAAGTGLFGATGFTPGLGASFGGGFGLFTEGLTSLGLVVPFSFLSSATEEKNSNNFTKIYKLFYTGKTLFSFIKISLDKPFIPSINYL